MANTPTRKRAATAPRKGRKKHPGPEHPPSGSLNDGELHGRIAGRVYALYLQRGAPVASIGEAGTFDGIFLTGILAVLLAEERQGNP